MAFYHKNCFILGIVSLLGLLSCSQDKNVVYQPQRPEAQAVGAMDAQKRMLWIKDLRTLELGGDLVIDLLKQQDFQRNPIVVRVQSWCQTDATKGSLTHDVYFQNQFSLPLLQILSREALLSTSQKPLVCDLTLTLTDGNTSAVSIFPLKSVVIQNSHTFNNLGLFDQMPSPLVFETIKSEILPKGQAWILSCTDFQKTLFQEQDVTLEKLMLSSSTHFSQWKNSQQLCRLLVEGDVWSLSRPFVLAFSPKPLVIQSQYLPLPTVFGPVGPRTILHLQLLNPNPYPVDFQMRGLQLSKFLFRPVYAGGVNRGLVGSEHSSSLNWTLWPTLFETKREDDLWTVQIPPGESVQLQADSTQSFDCGGLKKDPTTPDGRSPGSIGLWVLNRPAFAGLFYSFEIGTVFSLKVTETDVAVMDLQGLILQQQNGGSLPLWDLQFVQVKRTHSIQHSATSNEAFLSSVDEAFDLCRPL